MLNALSESSTLSYAIGCASHSEKIKVFTSVSSGSLEGREV
jgi:hypothetical protein